MNKFSAYKKVQSEQPCIRTSNGKQEESPNHVPTVNSLSLTAPPLRIPQGKRMMKVVAKRLEKLLHKNIELSKSDESTNSMKIMGRRNQSHLIALKRLRRRCNVETKMWNHLKTCTVEFFLIRHMVNAKDLNALLLAPESQLRTERICRVTGGN